MFVIYTWPTFYFFPWINPVCQEWLSDAYGDNLCLL